MREDKGEQRKRRALESKGAEEKEEMEKRRTEKSEVVEERLRNNHRAINNVIDKILKLTKNHLVV